MTLCTNINVFKWFCVSVSIVASREVIKRRRKRENAIGTTLGVVTVAVVCVCVVLILYLLSLSLIQLKTVRGRHDGSPDWLNNRIKNQSQKTASRFLLSLYLLLFCSIDLQWCYKRVYMT